MKVQSFESNYISLSETPSYSALSGMQRYILRRFHPQAIFLDIAASLWAVYFFWHHEWMAALAVVVASRLLGTVLASKMDYDVFAATVWGKLAFLHLHPANVVIQLAGAVALFYGIWSHATTTILAGLTALFLGHLCGWSKVMRGI